MFELWVSEIYWFLAKLKKKKIEHFTNFLNKNLNILRKIKVWELQQQYAFIMYIKNEKDEFLTKIT